MYVLPTPLFLYCSRFQIRFQEMTWQQKLICEIFSENNSFNLLVFFLISFKSNIFLYRIFLYVLFCWATFYLPVVSSITGRPILVFWDEAYQFTFLPSVNMGLPFFTFRWHLILIYFLLFLFCFFVVVLVFMIVAILTRVKWNFTIDETAANSETKFIDYECYI